jgi:hypothetical protein
VLGQIDLAHPPGAQQPPEAILPELSGLSNLPAQPGDRACPVRRADGQDGQDQRISLIGVGLGAVLGPAVLSIPVTPTS